MWAPSRGSRSACPSTGGWGADGQEHHDVQGHPRTPGKQPSSGETAASYRGNVGFVFTKEGLTEISDTLLANKCQLLPVLVPLPRVNSVPAQNTGLGPEKTSFFQALGITTDISRAPLKS
ncbi:60S acidic ribosomal protein P0 [Myotis davidii]|uniref:Large ribosomal subunit protein uL10 n=1 Tax=Myotis davidii TaxID=225400 RepID=L5LMT4_MYODS|nr:60S acidic ribosomal protein P0 [Myotis davidii]